MEQILAGIVLLSARPEAYKSLMSALSSAGVHVRVARHPDRALEVLSQPAGLVLVDMEHRSAVDHRVVARLNDHRGDSVVLALIGKHPDSEDHTTSGLAVDGYCRAGEGPPVFHPLAGGVRAAVSSRS